MARNKDEYDGILQSKTVSPPSSEMRDSPLVCVQINEQWVSHVSGMVEVLGDTGWWKDYKDFAQQQIYDLLDQLGQEPTEGGCSDTPPEAQECCAKVYYPGHPAITFKPSDPFVTPGYIPAPYARQPFTLGQKSYIPGSIATDAYFTFNNLAESLFDNPIIPDSLEFFQFIAELVINQILQLLDSIDFENAGNLCPRFQFKFSGKGRIYLHLIKVPLGGKALVTVDGQLTEPRYRIAETSTLSISSIKSVLDRLGEFSSIFNTLGNLIGLSSLAFAVDIAQNIVEIPIETDGDHHIDVTFIPTLPTSFDSLSDFVLGFGWGGGLRKIVTVCEPIEVECPPAEPPTPPELRITDCNVEWLNPDSAEWEVQLEIPDCPPEPPAPPQLRIGSDCVEWLNPETSLWECYLDLSQYRQTIIEEITSDCGCDDDCEDCDCEDCDENCEECE